MKRALLIALPISLLMWLAIFGAIRAVANPPHLKLAPPVGCTSANRMDIFIDEDNIMWECQCQMLRTGNICSWQVIGGVDAPSIRRHRRHARLIPVLVIRVHYA